MSALDDLKTRIDAAIYSNTEQNISGDGLQTVLDDMVDTMGVSVSQNTSTDNSDVAALSVGETPYNIYDKKANERIFGVKAFLVPSQGWQEYQHSFIAGKSYKIINVGNIDLGYTSLKNGTTSVTSEQTIAVGGSYIFIPSANADRFAYYLSSSNYKPVIIIQDEDTINSQIVAINKYLDTYVGNPIQGSGGSGWQEMSADIAANKHYIYRNIGAGTITYIRLYNGSTQILEKSVSLATGDYIDIMATSSANKVRFYGSGSMVLQIYSLDTLLGKDFDNLKKNEMLQNSGDATNNVVSQDATTKLIKSQFSSISDYLKGVKNIYIIGSPTYKQLYKHTKYKVTRYAYSSSMLYIEIDAYDGSSWDFYDEILINPSTYRDNTHKSDLIKSEYGLFMAEVVWDELIAASSVVNIDVEIKPNAVRYFDSETRNLIDGLSLYNQGGEFSFKDTPKHYIDVDVNGVGGTPAAEQVFTTIGAAYAAITDSAYNNQYEIRVFPGIYYEENLIPPAFTHTHGLHPNSVIVTSVGLETSTQPVFDEINTCKLSNMTIISAHGYCIHIDSGVGGRYVINENLYCKKVYNATEENPEGDDVRNLGWRNGSYFNPSVIGMGMGGGTYKFIFDNCTFENGEVAAHTNADNDTYPQTQLIYDNCKLTNAYIFVMHPNGYPIDGMYILAINGLKTQIGRASLKMQYKEDEKPWSVIGGENENFAVDFSNISSGGTSLAWENINTTDKAFAQLGSGVAVTAGKWIDNDGNICSANASKYNVWGVCLESKSADSGEACAIWVGNAYPHTAADGEYGIADDGTLSSAASTKIGFVKNNIFYRY